MLFYANPYEVEIWSGGEKTHQIPTNDASSTYRSIKLDKLEEKSISVLKKHGEIFPKVDEILKTKAKVAIIDLPEEDRKTLVQLEDLQKEMRLHTVEFIDILVKDPSRWESVIDEIPGTLIQHFLAALKRAAMGHTDSRPGVQKKKILSKKKNAKSVGKNSSKNSTSGATRRKR